MKKIIYSVLMSLMSSTLIAQNAMGEIKGKVFEFNSKEPLPFAHATVFKGNEKITVAADINGKFTINPLPPGTYYLEVTSPFLDTFKLAGIQVNAEKITFIDDIYLTEGLLKEVEVSYYREKLIDPEDTKIMTISAKDIENLPQRRDLSQIAKAFSSEIMTSEDGNEIYFRGSRNGDVLYYVDGIKSRVKPLLPASSIHSMRVYTGGLPAKYGDVMGGVIMVETKNYFDYYNIWKGRKEMEEYKKEHQ